MTSILTAEIAHHVQIPRITNNSVYVNQVTNTTPNVAMPNIIFEIVARVWVLRLSVRRNAHVASIAYPTNPMAGTGIVPNR